MCYVCVKILRNFYKNVEKTLWKFDTGPLSLKGKVKYQPIA